MQFLHGGNAFSSIVQVQHSLIYKATDHRGGSFLRGREKVPDLLAQGRNSPIDESNERMIYVANMPAVGLSLGQRFAEFRAATAERIQKDRLYRRTVSELGSLSGRDLADLGIARSQIKAIAWEAAYGK